MHTVRVSFFHFVHNAKLSPNQFTYSSIINVGRYNQKVINLFKNDLYFIQDFPFLCVLLLLCRTRFDDVEDCL